MARKKKIGPTAATSVTLLDVLVVDPMLTERPPNSFTVKEMALAKQCSTNTIWKKLAALPPGTLKQARIRQPDAMGRLNNTVVYWIEEPKETDSLDESDQVSKCLSCGRQLDYVRPGKWQCPKCG